MKLFDYKFLILLALTLVVYFIFREVLDLRKKIDKLQTNIDDLNNKKLIEDNKDSKPVPAELANKPSNTFQIPLPKKNVPKETVKLNPEVNVMTIPKLTHNKLSTVEESQHVSESESAVDSNNEERLAIYSNDNHEDVAEEFSLDETSDINTQDILNNITEDDSSIHSDKNSSPKKKNLLVEIEGDDISNDIEVTNEEIQLETNNSNSENKYTLSSLMRSKLNELQCLAEENKIDIYNSTKNRKKTKTELSNDLLNHFESR